jgi:hypothetical protein
MKTENQWRRKKVSVKKMKMKIRNYQQYSSAEAEMAKMKNIEENGEENGNQWRINVMSEKLKMKAAYGESGRNSGESYGVMANESIEEGERK